MKNSKTEAVEQSLWRAPRIAERLKAAQESLAELQQRHKRVALDSLSGDGDAAASLTAIRAEIAATQTTVEDLTAAYTAAVEADEAQQRAQFAEQHRSQVRVLRSHLNARQKAAEAMSSALEQAVKQWRLLIDHSAKARAAIVVGTWPNHESFTEFLSLHRAVEQELYRLGGDPTLGNKKSFPGAVAHDMMMLNQPEKITPIALKLSGSSEQLIDMLTGKEVV